MITLTLIYGTETKLFTSGEVEGLDEVSITLRRNDETGSVVNSFSSELTFTGEAYDWIKYILMDSPTALTNEIKAIIKDDCCSKEYEFKVISEGVSVDCINCNISINLIENTPESEAYLKLNDTFIFDDWSNFTKRKHPRFVYCNDIRPESLHWVLMIYGFLFYFIIILVETTFYLVAFAIKLIQWVIDIIDKVAEILGISKDATPDDSILGSLQNINLLSELQRFNQMLKQNLLGCGHTHPSPFVRDYIINAASKHGITFESSILNNINSEYYNLTLFSAFVTKGTKIGDKTTFWVDEDKPILTCIGLLDLLKPVFNAEYKIIGNRLIFECKDFFFNFQNQINLDNQTDNIISCKSQFNTEKKNAILDFKYSVDVIDNVSRDVENRYNGMIDWNTNNNAKLSGIKKIDLLQISPAKVIDDGTGDDEAINFFTRQSFYSFLFGNVDIAKQSLLMNTGRAVNYKLLIWDNSSGYEYAKVKNYGTKTWNDINGKWYGTSAAFNFPMWFNASTGSLQEFYEINNPNNSPLLNTTTTLELVFDCELLDVLDINSVVLYNGVKGIIKEIKIDYKQKILTLTIEQ